MLNKYQARQYNEKYIAEGDIMPWNCYRFIYREGNLYHFIKEIKSGEISEIRATEQDLLNGHIRIMFKYGLTK